MAEALRALKPGDQAPKLAIRRGATSSGPRAHQQVEALEDDPADRIGEGGPSRGKPRMDLSISQVTKRFGKVKALDDVSLEVAGGGFVCFLGPSGCGKTTLLRIVAGLDQADSGRILVGGRDISTTSARERNFGIVFQSYSLFPTLTAAQNVAYGLECRKWAKPETRARVEEMLRLVHLQDHAGKIPHQLSGGQQQRVALARAIAPKPSLLLLDEPLSALDAKVREELRSEIKAVQEKLGVTTIMVTHDQEEALAMADVIVVMRDGRIDQIGGPADLYERPQTRFVAEFIGRMNVLETARGPQGEILYGGAALRVAEGGAFPAARLGLRPEQVGLGAPGLAGENILAGRVAGVSYLGNLTRVTLETESGGPLMAELHGGARIPAVGEPVSIHLPAQALRVLS